MSIPITISTPRAAALMGFSRATLARHAERGIKVGRTTITPVVVGTARAWPTAPIIEALGLDEDAAAVALGIDSAEEVRA